MNTSWKLFSFVGFSIFLSNLSNFASAAVSPGASSAELARINGTVITVDEFNKKYKESLKFFRYKAPTKKNVLDDLVKRELGIQEAKKSGIEKEADVRDRIDTVLYHSLLDKKLASKFDAIRITDDEIKSYYKENPEVRTSHIFVQVRFDANAGQEKLALEKIKKIEGVLNKGDKSFTEVARTYSEGVAAASGGDIDFQTKDKLDPSYYEASKKLKVGQVSPIVRTQFGYHIIKLTSVKSYDDIDKGAFKRILFDEKRAQIYEKYMDDLKKSYNISVNYNLLKD